MVGVDGKVGSRDPSRVTQLRAVAERVINDMDYAAALQANLRRMGSTDLASAFDNTPHVKALNVIYLALLDQLILVLMRMYDKHDVRRKNDKASLRSIQSLLKDEYVQANLIAEAAQRWPSPQGIARAREAARKRLTDIIEGVDDVLSQAPFEAWLKSLREYRDVFIGHSLVKELRRAPIYASIGEILNKTLEIGQNLQLITQHRAPDWKQAWRARQGEARCFWDTVVLGTHSRETGQT